MKREQRSRSALDFMILTLALLGFAINLFLVARRFTDPSAGIAGCGGGSCEEIMASRWSVVFGVPVPVLGMLAYAGLMVSLTAWGRRSHEPVLGAISGAAMWFFFVQSVLLERYCAWCNAAHAIGAAVVGFSLIRQRCGGSGNILLPVGKWTLAAFLGIGLAQVYGPVPAGHRIENVASINPIPPSGEGRMVEFAGGRKSYDVSKNPRLGPADAKHVMVEYFDYQCAACRTMAGFLEAFTAKHPREVAILLLPAPLDGACNDRVPEGGEHPGSCEIGRIALAVWKLAPAAFPAWHKAVIADASVASAYRHAFEAVKRETLETALSDPAIDQMIRSNIADLHHLSKSTDKLPKLLIKESRIVHGLPSGEEEFIRVIDGELGLQ